MWTLEQAMSVIEPLEPKLGNIGFHCALNGSVLYNGKSEKDLDLIIYPHTKVNGVTPDWDSAKSLLKDYFGAVKITDCGGVSQLRDDKEVSWLKTSTGKRIDFFFLQ